MLTACILDQQQFAFQNVSLLLITFFVYPS